MKQLRILITYLTLVVIFSACKQDAKNEEKVVFVDNYKLFEEFEMKKSLDKKIEKEFAIEKQKLDQMAIAFQNAIPKEKEKLKQDYVLYESKFNETFTKVSDEYTKEVYSKLNEFIKEFGKKNNYDIIIGTGGQGNIMYVDTNVNITNKLIKFVNTKFNE
jgi:outer membrane protein